MSLSNSCLLWYDSCFMRCMCLCRVAVCLSSSWLFWCYSCWRSLSVLSPYTSRVLRQRVTVPNTQHTHAHKHTHIYIYIYIYVCMYVCMYIYIYIYVYIYIYICTYSSFYIYIYIYTHTHSHTHTPVWVLPIIGTPGLHNNIYITARIYIYIYITLAALITITRFPLIIFSPGAGLLRNPLVHR